MNKYTKEYAVSFSGGKLMEYTVSVRGGNMKRFDEPLVFRTGSAEEVLNIVGLMLEYGHSVSIQCEEAGRDPQEDEEEKALELATDEEPLL